MTPKLYVHSFSPSFTQMFAMSLLMSGSACKGVSGSASDSTESETETDTTGEGDTNTSTDTDTSTELTSVLLRVITPDGTAIGLATVTVDGIPYFTDNAGFLLFTDIEADQFNAQVDASGHTSSAVSFELSESLQAYSEVRLFPLGPAQPLDADLGGTVEYDGVSVEIPPGSLVNEFGEPVTGEVEVTITSLDPSTDDLLALPGPLEAKSASDEDVYLLSFAMAEISIWQGKAPLQLAPGAHAQIEIALPTELAASLQAGDAIPAWWLDLDAGIWQEESTGSVQPSQSDPDKLVWKAAVSHFTWYNCDYPLFFQDFECYIVTVVDDHGIIVPNKSFTTIAQSNGVFKDVGYSPYVEGVNVGSNCIFAPISSTPTLTIAGIQDFEYIVTEGTGEYHGMCREGGVPNQTCTKVTVMMPAQAPPIVCQPGAFTACEYSGPLMTENIGICQAGYDYCIEGGIAWSGCEGEVVPMPESCLTLYDDDCDGDTTDPDAIECACNPGEMVDCYTGPLNTNNVGECSTGYRMCDPELQEYGACLGEITPQPEDCMSVEDEDCDGLSACVPPEVPTLQLGFSQVKRFDFSWTPALGAQFYRLLESADGSVAHVQVGGDLVGLATSWTVPLHFRPNASYVLQACNVYGCTDSAEVDVVGSMAQAVGYFKASNTDAGDAFGWSVALSGDGNTLAVGAPFETSSALGIDGNQADNSLSNAGAVYVYERDSMNDWTQQAYVKASNTGVGDFFGYRVALSGDGSTLAVGATFEASNALGIDGNQANDSAPQAGAVYVYERDLMNVWTQQAYVKASNTGAGDRFGYSVALSGDGNTLAVGAATEDSSALGIGGNPAVQADDSAHDAGAVYVYERDGMDVWMQSTYVKASNSGAEDRFGYRVALSVDGSTLAVGAIYEASNALGIDGNQADNSAAIAGAVYVFERGGMNVWTQQAYVKASNTGAYDYFGFDVALSGDGSTLAVGACLESSNALGIDGNQADNSATNAGAVYVYERDGMNVWTQSAYVKASDTYVGDQFGTSVALSMDGNTLVVGAYLEDSNALGINDNQADNTAQNAGAVYVYERDGMNVWTQQSYVKASNSGADDGFGIGVALSGDASILAVGAYLEDSNAVGIGGNTADDSAPQSGAVYFY